MKKQTVEQWKENLALQIAGLEAEVKRLDEAHHRSYKNGAPYEVWSTYLHQLQGAKEKLKRARMDVLPTEKKYVSQYLWSDVHAFEVIEERTPLLMIVRELDAKLTEEAEKRLRASFVPGGFCGHFDNDAQEWEFSSNERNPKIAIRRHKNGNYYEAGSRSFPYVVHDHPYKHYDYNF